MPIPITDPGNIWTLGKMIDELDLPKAVINYYDWQNLYDDARAYAVFTHLGKTEVAMPQSPSGAGNYKILFNKPTGILTEYVGGTGDVTIASSYVNLAVDTAGENGASVHPEFSLSQVNSQTASIDTLSAYLGLVNVNIRPGLGFRVIGTFVKSDDSTFDGMMAFVITSTTGGITCKLMDSSIPTSATACTVKTIKTGATWFVTEFADFDGEAPAPDDMMTTQNYNFLQFYDATIGKGYSELSQSTYFDNTFEGLFKPLRSAMFRKINQDILFGMKGSVPNTSTDKGAMKGIWGLMNLHNPALNTDHAKPLVKVENATSIDYWKLAKFIDQRPTYCNKDMLCILTPEMMNLLVKSAYEQRGDLVRTTEVEFPTCTMEDTIVRVGSTRLHCVSDTMLNRHPAFVDEASAIAHAKDDSVPLLKASQGLVMLMLDSRYIGLKYQDNKKMGLMIPQMSNIDPINGERREKAHMTACLTTAIWNPQMHAFYGINVA